MSFEDLAKVLLVDECAHAERVLINGICGDPKFIWRSVEKATVTEIRKKLDVISKSNLRRDLAGIRQDPKRYSVLQYFRIKKYQDLVEPLALENNKGYPENWVVLLNNIGEDIETAQAESNEDRIFLKPTSRFLVEMVLALSKDPIAVLGELTEGGETGMLLLSRGTISHPVSP